MPDTDKLVGWPPYVATWLDMCDDIKWSLVNPTHHPETEQLILHHMTDESDRGLYNLFPDGERCRWKWKPIDRAPDGTQRWDITVPRPS